MRAVRGIAPRYAKAAHFRQYRTCMVNSHAIAAADAVRQDVAESAAWRASADLKQYDCG
jgi:hypothetical protein